jgi:hypothetical protein
VHARLRGLDNNGLADLVRSNDGFFYGRDSALANERQSVSREESAREIGIEPALGIVVRRACAPLVGRCH